MSNRMPAVMAVSWLTLCELLRQRTWLVVVVAVLLVAAWVPSLAVAEPSDRQRLGVAVITGVTGFIVVVLGALLGAGMVRRDLDDRVAMILFAKPLSRSAYLAGRWLGLVLGLGLAVAALLGVGILALSLRLGGLPTTTAVVAPERCDVVHVDGQTQTIAAQRPVLLPAGGQARSPSVRWAFAGLSPGHPVRLLVRAEVSGVSGGAFVRRAPVRVSAYSPQGERQALSLADASPYGAVDGQPAVVEVQPRGGDRPDLARDYVVLLVPGTLIGPDGRVLVTVERLNAAGRVVVSAGDGVLVSAAAGWFPLSLFQAGLVVWAQAAALVAISVCGGCIGSLPTALLLAFGLWFGGSVLSFASAWVEPDTHGQVFTRLMTLFALVVPDFSRFPVATDLAASRAVGAATSLSAWVYYGIWTAVFLAIGRLGLRRDLV